MVCVRYDICHVVSTAKATKGLSKAQACSAPHSINTESRIPGWRQQCHHTSVSHTGNHHLTLDTSHWKRSPQLHVAAKQSASSSQSNQRKHFPVRHWVVRLAVASSSATSSPDLWLHQPSCPGQGLALQDNHVFIQVMAWRAADPSPC